MAAQISPNSCDSPLQGKPADPLHMSGPAVGPSQEELWRESGGKGPTVEAVWLAGPCHCGVALQGHWPRPLKCQDTFEVHIVKKKLQSPESKHMATVASKNLKQSKVHMREGAGVWIGSQRCFRLTMMSALIKQHNKNSYSTWRRVSGWHAWHRSAYGKPSLSAFSLVIGPAEDALTLLISECCII